MFHQQALIVVSGNLVEPAKVKLVKDGTLKVYEFRVGVDGPGNEDTSFIPITAFGDELGDKLKKAEKGSFVSTVARLKQVRWEKDGKKLSRLSVIALQVRVYPQ